MIPDEHGKSIEWEDMDDADGLMKKLKRAGFRFKVDMREEVNESVNIKALAKQFRKNEDENRHTENYLMLAKAFGSKREIMGVEAIIRRNKRQGHTNPADTKWMFDNIGKYFHKLKESLEESAIMGLNKSSAKYKAGKAAAKKGIKYDANPHAPGVKRLNWSTGHNDFRADALRKAGKPNYGARGQFEEVELDEASYRGYEIKRQNNKYGHPLIVPALKLTGVNMKDIKQLIDRHFLFSNEEVELDEAKGHLSYDEWLKQVKGIKKGAYGINSDEHAKYSGEWRAYIKGLFDNLPSAKGAKNVTKLSPTAHTKLGENELDEIVGGRGEMTVTKDGGVMIIKTRDWQTYKAKGWVKREEVENESLDLSATGDTITSNASQEDEGKELNEILPSGKSGHPELTEASAEGEELNEFWPFGKKTKLPKGYNPKPAVKAYDLFHKAYDELKKSGVIDRSGQERLQELYYHLVVNHLGSREANRLKIKTINGPDRRYGDGKIFQDATR